MKDTSHLKIIYVVFYSIKNIFYELDDDVKIYPSHDYFLTNLNFAKTVDPTNSAIEEYTKKYNKEIAEGRFIITTIGEEKRMNPFFRAMTKKYQSLNNNILYSHHCQNLFLTFL